jgi:Putative auto-transporter adhesin, head GIN domain
MNKRFFLSVFAVTILVALMACMAVSIPQVNPIKGSGNVVTESRPVSGFSRLSLDNVGELTLVQGNQESLEIEADDNLMPDIKSEVQGSTLHIYYDKPGATNFNPSVVIKYRLTMKEIEGLSISGAADINAGKIETGSLEIITSGAGLIKIEELNADRLTIDISGIGNVEIGKGKVPVQEVTLSGTGSYHAGNLECTQMKIDISGLGNAEVWVTEKLDIDISGAGTIEYYGSPKLSQNVSGAGRVKSLGDK